MNWPILAEAPVKITEESAPAHASSNTTGLLHTTQAMKVVPELLCHGPGEDHHGRVREGGDAAKNKGERAVTMQRKRSPKEKQAG